MGFDYVTAKIKNEMKASNSDCIDKDLMKSEQKLVLERMVHNKLSKIPWVIKSTFSAALGCVVVKWGLP